MDSTTVGRLCGAWPQLGGCVLQAGHNVGHADLPDAHQFPPGQRHVAVYLPLYNGEEQYTPDGPAPRTCGICGHDIRYGAASGDFLAEPGPPPDPVVLSATYGTTHATCYLAELQAQQVPMAWMTVAREIARHPSKHTAAEIRAAITALTRIIREK